MQRTPGPRRSNGLSRAERRARLLAGGATIALHLAAVVALLWPYAPHRTVQPTLAALQLTMVDTPDPAPPGPPDPAGPETAQEIVPPPPKPPNLFAPAIRIRVNDTSDILSDAQLAGAASAGDGAAGGNGGCDTARLLQAALRRDPLVRNALQGANRLGKSVMLWNGDWVQTGGQEGKGLSAVREAVIWELAFAPEKCRNQRVHGLIVLSLADSGTRFAIGAGDWRWSDLLGLRR